MRYYFHITKDWTILEDDAGLDFSSFGDALTEGNKIVQDLLNDPEQQDLHGGTVKISGSGGLVFVALPISPYGLPIPLIA